MLNFKEKKFVGKNWKKIKAKKIRKNFGGKNAQKLLKKNCSKKAKKNPNFFLKKFLRFLVQSYQKPMRIGHTIDLTLKNVHMKFVKIHRILVLLVNPKRKI